MALEALNTARGNIAQNLPAGTENAVKKSFLYSAGIVTLISGINIPAGALAGSLAAVACLIDSCISAIIRHRRPNLQHLTYYQDYAKRFSAIIAANLLLFPFLGIGVYLVASVAFNFFIDIFSQKFGQDRPLTEIHPIIIV